MIGTPDGRKARLYFVDGAFCEIALGYILKALASYILKTPARSLSSNAFFSRKKVARLCP
jgi:hypothetical protein